MDKNGRYDKIVLTIKHRKGDTGRACGDGGPEGCTDGSSGAGHYGQRETEKGIKAETVMYGYRGDCSVVYDMELGNTIGGFVASKSGGGEEKVQPEGEASEDEYEETFVNQIGATIDIDLYVD